MSQRKDKLISAFNNYINAVNAKLITGASLLVYEQAINIGANASRNYDITTLYPDHANYRLLSAKVEVLVKNKDTESETYDMFINSEAVITTAINADGIVKIHNTSDESQTVVIKIFTPSVKK